MNMCTDKILFFLLILLGLQCGHVFSADFINTYRENSVGIVGVILGNGEEEESKYPSVSFLLRNSPAESEKKIKLGDYLLGVKKEGRSLFTSVYDWPLSEVAKVVRGKINTEVSLLFRVGPGNSEEGDFYFVTLTRVEGWGCNDEVLSNNIVREYRGTIVFEEKEFGTIGSKEQRGLSTNHCCLKDLKDLPSK